MSILNSLIALPLARRRSAIELFKKYPLEIQEEARQNLLATAARTVWGEKYQYQNIKTVQQFQEAVPVQEYQDLYPYIQRMQAGEENVLWPGRVKWFARSSGTTNAKSKFIPITAESLENCHYQGGKDIISLYTAACPDNHLFSGKTLSLGGTQEKDQAHDKYCGDLSAILMSNLPFWIQLIRTPNLEIALLGEWEEKIKQIAADSSSRNITCLTGVPSWMLVLLNHLLVETKKANILEIWPNLELFIHGGINFAPYRDQFAKLIPAPRMNYFEVYNASEGFFAMNESPADEDMLLMLDYGVFYEFIPTEDLGQAKPRALGLSEVELGKNYALVISTNGGLWRYLIGDTIVFTKLQPFRIKISGRTKHFINAFGEELMVGNADRALESVCRQTSTAIVDYTAAPFFMLAGQSGRHQWLIEFREPPTDLADFARRLDESLKALNSDYEAKRYKDITLSRPEIILARPGLFYDWLKEKNKVGGQHKVPRLANSREYLDELLAINKRL